MDKGRPRPYDNKALELLEAVDSRRLAPGLTASLDADPIHYNDGCVLRCASPALIGLHIFDLLLIGVVGIWHFSRGGGGP